jgi:hypothetical protein
VKLGIDEKGNDVFIPMCNLLPMVNPDDLGEWHYFSNRIGNIIHTYHSRFIPEGVAEVSQLFLQDTHVLPKLVSYEKHCRLAGGKPQDTHILPKSVSYEKHCRRDRW